jgi:hypothetical protein
MGETEYAINMLYDTIKYNHIVTNFKPEIWAQYVTCVRLLLYEYAYKERSVKFKKEHLDVLTNADLTE